MNMDMDAAEITVCMYDARESQDKAKQSKARWVLYSWLGR